MFILNEHYIVVNESFMFNYNGRKIASLCSRLIKVLLFKSNSVLQFFSLWFIVTISKPYI